MGLHFRCACLSPPSSCACRFAVLQEGFFYLLLGYLDCASFVRVCIGERGLFVQVSRLALLLGLVPLLLTLPQAFVLGSRLLRRGGGLPVLVGVTQFSLLLSQLLDLLLVVPRGLLDDLGPLDVVPQGGDDPEFLVDCFL